MFLGALFILGTVLIIYYKQISEGYDDKERFAIMSKVGLSSGEIKKTIRFQVLSVFFLPLIMAVIHIAAAFPVICKLLDHLQHDQRPAVCDLHRADHSGVRALLCDDLQPDGADVLPDRSLKWSNSIKSLPLGRLLPFHALTPLPTRTRSGCGRRA